MIRNVVTVKLVPGADRAAVEALMDRFRGLRSLPGCLSYAVGWDLGLKEGAWSFAIVADFADEGAYRAYDLDADHNAMRADLAPLAEAVARAQIRL